VIDTEIKRLLCDIDYTAEIGKIDESERLYEEVERLRGARADLIILAENPSLAAKHTKVCDICGAIQAVNDTEKRNQTHLEGKVHTGFALLRKELDKLIKQKEIHKLYQEVSRKEEKKARDGKHEKSRDRSRDRESRDSRTRRKHEKKHRKRDSDERLRKSRHTRDRYRDRKGSDSGSRSVSRSRSRDRKRRHHRY